MTETIYDPSALREASKEEQIETMERWFFAHFEDPGVKTPHDPASGGYVWIWGGPFRADEELRAEFEGTVREEAITELLAKLASRSEDWALKETPDDYDEGLYESISENALARKTLDDSLTTIRELLDVQVPDSLKDAYLRLLFANAISALETFLSDTFINRVVPDSDLLQTYVDGEPKFIERKIPYKDVLREGQRLTEEARKELLDTVWHNMGKVKPMVVGQFGLGIGTTRL